MGQSMLPILVLTTVALSTSDVLPILSDKDTIQPYNMDYQENDNIFHRKYRNAHNINYNTRKLKSPFGKITDIYMETDNDQDSKDFIEALNKEENYDDEGYRKKQWHNYPRQLNRLQKLHYKHDSFFETPKSVSNNEELIDSHINDFTTNEYSLYGYNDDSSVYNSILAATNPYLILKVQLAYLRDDIANVDLNDYLKSEYSKFENNRGKEKKFKFLSQVIKPVTNVVKVKREKSVRNRVNEILGNDSSGFEIGDKKTVKKRLFSLWSRLQGLTHRGHELHHRRHLHAFYGLPDNNGNGIVTAQTRANFIRPPGSPLRWG